MSVCFFFRHSNREADAQVQGPVKHDALVTGNLRAELVYLRYCILLTEASQVGSIIQNLRRVSQAAAVRNDSRRGFGQCGGRGLASGTYDHIGARIEHSLPECHFRAAEAQVGLHIEVHVKENLSYRTQAQAELDRRCKVNLLERSVVKLYEPACIPGEVSRYEEREFPTSCVLDTYPSADICELQADRSGGEVVIRTKRVFSCCAVGVDCEDFLRIKSNNT